MSKLKIEKLRFTKDDGSPYADWVSVRLGDIGKTYSGLSGKSKNDFNVGKPFITYMNVYKNSVLDKEDFNYVKIKKGEKQNRVFKGDIIFTTSSETQDEVGITSYIDMDLDECYLNSFCFGFRTHEKELKFLAYYFRSPKFRKKIFPLSQGATRYNLSKNNLLNLEITIPADIEEQNKIANFFSALDKKISIQEKKLSLLKDYKRGLLQQIFSQQLRFKNSGGKDYSDWETVRLGNICEFNPKINKLPKKFIYIDLESVTDGKFNPKEPILLKNAPSRAKRLLENEDIIFQTVRPYQRNNLYFNLETKDSLPLMQSCPTVFFPNN